MEVTKNQAQTPEEKAKKASNLKRLAPFGGSRRALTYLSLVLAGASALVALGPYLCLWHIIDGVLALQGDYSDLSGLIDWGWWALGLALAALLVYVSGLMCSHAAAFRVARNLRAACMRHIATLPLACIESKSTGALRKVIDESSTATETYLAHRLPDKAVAVVTPVALLALMLVFDWRLGLLSLVAVVAAFAVMMLGMLGPMLKQKMAAYTDALENMSTEAVEYVRGVPVIKTFGQTVFSFKRFKAAIDHYGEFVIAYTCELRLPMVFYTTAINAVFALLIAGGLWFTADGVTPTFLTNLIFYVIITPIITVTMNKVMYASEDGMVVADALDRIDEVLAMQPLPQASAAQRPKDASLSFENVSFRYGEDLPCAVDGVSLQVPTGSTVALVGPSGGGKTTLASLVARIGDVGEGAVRIGGVDVRNMTEADLMDTVSIVFQDSKLLKASISDNVRLGRPQATDEQVAAALHAAQCDDILAKFPQGANTQVGSKGVYLSGGEQQRLALARAFLKDAPVLVLDEATAFADPDNEALMSQALARLAQGRTVLKIAHRLSTVVDADLIAVVQRGRVVQSGTHERLLADDKGLYASMWSHYLAGDAWTVAKEAM